MLQTVEAIDAIAGLGIRSNIYHWHSNAGECGEGELAGMGPSSKLVPKVVYTVLIF
jgi:hypothetical protein